MACAHRPHRRAPEPPAPRRLPRPLTSSAATAALAVALTAGTLAGAPDAAAAQGPRGHDVSSHQKDVNWGKAKSKGARFVYVKATESHTYRNPYFTKQYNGAGEHGILRGAYHFALPDKSSGARQAAYFVRHGGTWRADGQTLPPALDLENNPYNGKHKCYGLSAAKLRSWIRSFSDETVRLTGRRPMIYTTAKWWNSCTDRSTAFAAQHPLWLASWSGSPGALPAGWTYWTIWQHDEAGRLPGDQNVFNGSMNQLRLFARS